MGVRTDPLKNKPAVVIRQVEAVFFEDGFAFILEVDVRPFEDLRDPGFSDLIGTLPVKIDLVDRPPRCEKLDLHLSSKPSKVILG